MVTCVSPADVNFEETLNALKYSNRARNIRNKPVVNRDSTSGIIVDLRRQVAADGGPIMVRLSQLDSTLCCRSNSFKQSCFGLRASRVKMELRS